MEGAHCAQHAWLFESMNTRALLGWVVV